MLFSVIAAVQKRVGPDAKPLPGRALRDVFAPRYVGTAVDATALDREPGYREVLAQQFSAVTPENAMKWAVVEPSRGKRDWSGADALVTFAARHDQRVRGHTLVWYAQNPSWVESLPADELRDALREHIRLTVDRFRGRIRDWDVVNEAISDDGGMRRWFMLDKLGAGYIADAFNWARDADPDARLWINEIGAESIGPKSDKLYDVVKRLVADGVPVGGVGFQTHTNLDGIPPSFAENLRRFAALGVKVAITELDVALPEPFTAADEDRQAQIYEQAGKVCREQPACVGVTVWGFTDRHSWIPANQPGNGDATLLDGDLNPKPAFTAFQRGLRG